MSVFGDAWDHLNSPDITCTSDGSLGLNHWGVSLGFMIGFLFLFIIATIMLYKRKKICPIMEGWRNFMEKMIQSTSKLAMNKRSTYSEIL